MAVRRRWRTMARASSNALLDRPTFAHFRAILAKTVQFPRFRRQDAPDRPPFVDRRLRMVKAPLRASSFFQRGIARMLLSAVAALALFAAPETTQSGEPAAQAPA